MATETIITRSGAIEAPIRMLDPFALRFVGLLDALAEHIWAEHDLEGGEPSDPAFNRKIARANWAQLQPCEVLAEMTNAPATIATDVPLRRMALLIATLVREGTASAFRLYAESRDAFALHLRVPGYGGASMRARGQIAAAEKRLALMATLTLYRQDGVELEAETAALAA